MSNPVVHEWDNRRSLLIPGDETMTIDIAVHHFIYLCESAIKSKGTFAVALAGGSTPKAIYERLTSYPYAEKVDWEKVYLFWSDERSVPPDSSESNYKMAMDAGFGKMPIPKNQIFRMVAEKEIEKNAEKYEELLEKHPLDLVILGMGDDGHTASLFPDTKALKVHDRLVVANEVPQKKTWRMTFTFPAINKTPQIVIYVIGAGKKHVVNAVFKEQTGKYPIQKVGTAEHPALWIMDQAASSDLLE